MTLDQLINKKVAKLELIKTRNILLNQFRQVVIRLNSRDHRDAKELDELIKQGQYEN